MITSNESTNFVMFSFIIFAITNNNSQSPAPVSHSVPAYIVRFLYTVHLPSTISDVSYHFWKAPTDMFDIADPQVPSPTSYIIHMEHR